MKQNKMMMKAKGIQLRHLGVGKWGEHMDKDRQWLGVCRQYGGRGMEAEVVCLCAVC